MQAGNGRNKRRKRMAVRKITQKQRNGKRPPIKPRPNQNKPKRYKLNPVFRKGPGGLCQFHKLTITSTNKKKAGRTHESRIES